MKLLLIAMQVFALDQRTKELARRIKPGSEVVVVKNLLSFTNVKNKGAAYGLLANNPKTLFTMTVAAAAWVISEVMALHRKIGLTGSQKASLACVAGGAAGNLFDRIRDKGVTDFIHIKLGKRAPVFNVADMFILFGVLSFLNELRKND